MPKVLCGVVLATVLTLACGGQEATTPTPTPQPPSGPSSPTPPTGPATLTQLALGSTGIVGGNGVTGTVTISSAAPAAGVEVTLTSANAAAVVPATVTIGVGATSATFSITTTAVERDTRVAINASAAGETRTAMLSVNTLAEVESLTTSFPYMSEGTTGYSIDVRLKQAVSTSAYVTIASSEPSLAPDEAAFFAPGTTQRSVQYSVRKTNDDVPVRLTATAGGRSVTLDVTVMPPKLVTLRSEQGDPVGRGETHQLNDRNNSFRAAVVCQGNGLLIEATDRSLTPLWNLNFWAPRGQKLAPGTYEVTTSEVGPLISVTPGPSATAQRRDCNRHPLGRFTIDKIDSAGSQVLRIRAAFEQHCSGEVASLRGEINLDVMASLSSSFTCR